MPIPTERPSLTKTLEDRYSSQKCGGAYDAKSVKTGQGSRMPVLDASGNGPSASERLWTNADFLVKQSSLQSEYKDVADGTTSKELSLLIKGFSNKKYKP